MSLLQYCTLKLVVALLSMEGQKALHEKYLNLSSKDKRMSYLTFVINDRLNTYLNMRIKFHNVQLCYSLPYQTLINCFYVEDLHRLHQTWLTAATTARPKTSDHILFYISYIFLNKNPSYPHESKLQRLS